MEQELVSFKKDTLFPYLPFLKANLERIKGTRYEAMWLKVISYIEIDKVIITKAKIIRIANICAEFIAMRKRAKETLTQSYVPIIESSKTTSKSVPASLPDQINLLEASIQTVPSSSTSKSVELPAVNTNESGSSDTSVKLPVSIVKKRRRSSVLAVETSGMVSVSRKTEPFTVKNSVAKFHQLPPLTPKVYKSSNQDHALEAITDSSPDKKPNPKRPKKAGRRQTEADKLRELINEYYDGDEISRLFAPRKSAKLATDSFKENGAQEFVENKRETKDCYVQLERDPEIEIMIEKKMLRDQNNNFEEDGSSEGCSERNNHKNDASPKIKILNVETIDSSRFEDFFGGK